MFGRRLLNNKHKLTNEFKQPVNNYKSNYSLNQKLNEDIKFNEENESDINFKNEINNKIDSNQNNKDYNYNDYNNKDSNNYKNNDYDYNLNDYNNENKKKKKSVIVNKSSNFFTFSSGINLNEENENESKGIYDINSSSGNFLKDNFSSQKYIENGAKKNKNELDHIFAPLTQDEITKIKSEKNNQKNNYINNNSKKFIPKKINLEEFNAKNQEIIDNYSKKNTKIKNNDEIELNLEEEDPYCNLDESSCEMQKISKKKFKLMDKLGIDLEDETDLNKDIDKIINDKVERIKEVKDHQRKCLLVENLDGLYGKSQNPNDILKDIYTTLNDENGDSEYEEEIDKWEKAQFKSGIRLNQLNLNEDFYAKNNNNEINLNYKYNNLYEKLNKKEGIGFDELISDVGQIVERDKTLLSNYVNKKNDYNIELNKIIDNEKKLEKDLNFYINQYCELKKKLYNILQEKQDDNNDKKDNSNANNEFKLDKFYISE